MAKPTSSTHNSQAEQRDTLAALQAVVARLEAENQAYASQLVEHEKALSEKDQLLAERQQRIEYLQEQLALLLSKRYGRQSEQLKHLQDQLFDEAELETEIRETEAALAEALQQSSDAEPGAEDSTDPNKPEADPATPISPPKRRPLPAHLKRVEIDVDVSDEDKQMMGDDWVRVGYETSEKLAVRDREYYVKQIRRAKYVRKADMDTGAPEAPIGPDEPVGIKVAPPLPTILPKAMADASQG